MNAHIHGNWDKNQRVSPMKIIDATILVTVIDSEYY